MAVEEPKAQKPPTDAVLRAQLRRLELEMELEEAKWTRSVFRNLSMSEAAAYTPERALPDQDERDWVMTSSGGNLDASRTYPGQPRLDDLRKASYTAWRRDPHARGILRTYVKFIIGRDFTLDFEDEARGAWKNRSHTTLVPSTKEEDPVMVRLLWEDFDRANGMRQRFKEIVLRTFRDGEALVRRFSSGDGRVSLRFIEPPSIDGDIVSLGLSNENRFVTEDDVQSEDEDQWEYGRLSRSDLGRRTTIKFGIEHIVDDPETVVAFWMPGPQGSTPTRIPAREVLHTKCLADSNDLRGYPLLDAVLRKLVNYEQWEEYRLVLNKVRTAVALVRKIEGTASQAGALIAGRTPSRAPASGRGTSMQTTSGRSEAMLRPGTILNAGPGVSYSYESPKLDARDAGEDGRRFLLTVASGVGLPEMYVTSDWSNSNYSSSVESRTPVVREWEDWQDFFEPHFIRIWVWVYEEALLHRGLPPTTKSGLSIQWPNLITKDAWKATERHAILNAARLLSKTTWSGLEDLVQDDELQNFAREDEIDLLKELPDPNLVAQNGGPPGAKPPASVQEARSEALAALAQLEEVASSPLADSDFSTSVRRYVESARPYVDALAEAAERGRERKSRKVPKPAKKWKS